MKHHVVEAHYYRESGKLDLGKVYEGMSVGSGPNIRDAYRSAAEGRDRAQRHAATWKRLARSLRERLHASRTIRDDMQDEIDALRVERDEALEDLAAERRRSEECDP